MTKDAIYTNAVSQYAKCKLLTAGTFNYYFINPVSASELYGVEFRVTFDLIATD